MYKESLNYLKLHYPSVLNIVKNEVSGNDLLEPIIEETRSHELTIKAVTQNQSIYIHSKYNPLMEAERIIQNYSSNISNDTHVMFYGIGLGYQIEYFTKVFPDTKFSIYEPSITLFKELLNNRIFPNFNTSNLGNIYLEKSPNSLEEYLNDFSSSIFGDVVLIPLPSYEKIFPNQFSSFAKRIKIAIEARVYNLGVDYHFARRWTLNSLMNLPTTLSTPNFIEEKKDYFKDKPVLIVSAGPSLQDEYENLRNIKEKGLAYIFAVGSANKALIANDILPDAVLTYDPQEHNFSVFSVFEKEGITSVPMIYGTSVGYETIQRYPGPKFHFITSQDTVSPYYLKNKNNSYIINDAFSIAIVTIDILSRLEVGMIILVGQNLAFKDNLFYSKDINRGKNKNAEIQKKDMIDLVEVEDVFGNRINTNSAFNQMRFLMQQYIGKNKHVEFINTTNGGAKIEGAPFQQLEDVINSRLQTKVVLKEAFSNNVIDSGLKYVTDKVRKMHNSMRDFVKLIIEIDDQINTLEEVVLNNRLTKIQSVYVNFDKKISKLLENEFYNVYIRPITRVQFELLEKSIQKVKNEENPKVKAIQIKNLFGAYLDICKQTYNDLAPTIKNYVHKYIENKDKYKESRRYESDSVEFHYTGNWLKQETNLKNNKFKDHTVYRCMKTTNKNEEIKFKFRGSFIRIIGGKHINNSSKISIKIDGIPYIFSSSDKLYDECFVIDYENVLFEKRKLSNDIHEIEITNLDENFFVFQAIEIDSNGRLMHKDEVLNIKEMMIGQRIRCNINDQIIDGVASISNIGQETKPLISYEKQTLIGDFYLIKSNQDIYGNDIFVSDISLPAVRLKYKLNDIYEEIVINKIPIICNEKESIEIVKSSSYFKEGRYPCHPFQAFNKDLTDQYQTWATEKEETSGWIEFSFPEPTLISVYTISPQKPHLNYDTALRMPQNWVFQAWGGDSWILLDERENVTDWVMYGPKRFFVINNKSLYKKFRIKVIKNNGDPEFLAIGEIEYN
ncbi:motility associated factor glycosyltransferase family protein [Cytobacillus gottheilii]|uniref:motility associated factor glycosyltransferase family protein n=1 Tax=Cytobacillus gottheilii TaxID=859144 RepID=UPI003CF934E4